MYQGKKIHKQSQNYCNKEVQHISRLTQVLISNSTKNGPYISDSHNLCQHIHTKKLQLEHKKGNKRTAEVKATMQNIHRQEMRKLQVSKKLDKTNKSINLYSINKTTWHAPNVGPPMPSDISFILHTTKRYTYELPA